MLKITKHSLARRIVLGKIIGLLCGGIYIAAFTTQGHLPLWSKLSLGTMILSVLLGVLIGFIGLFTRHPLFDFPMKWYFRGAFVGLMVHLVFILLAYDAFQVVMESPMVSWTGLESPFWALIDGTLIGLFTDYFLTKKVGEGKALKIA